MLRHRMAWNIAFLLAIGLIFPGLISVRQLGESVLDMVVAILSSQFVFAAIGVLLNPFAGIAIAYVFVVLFYKDTAAGQKSLAVKTPRKQQFLGKLRFPILGLLVAAIAAEVITSLNELIWAVLSLFPLIQVGLMLAARQLRNLKRTNA